MSRAYRLPSPSDPAPSPKTAVPPINRPLDPAETFFFLLDRLSNMNFAVFAARTGALDAQRVRAARGT
jgi:hypothetical protein